MSLSEESIDKPIEQIHPDNLPEAGPGHFSEALLLVIDRSEEHDDVKQGTHAHAHHGVPFLHSIVPGLEKLSATHHMGNFVAIRGTNEKFFESMPIYARIGMHLLFYGKGQVRMLETHKVEELLYQQSVKEGKIYDSPESVKSIPSFIHTYKIQLDELLDPDLSSYKTFNEFFYRRLRPDARPIQEADDPNVFNSAADSRLVVYSSVDLAKHFWIKGRDFTIPALLDVAPDSEIASKYANGSIGVFRLAPADYHRFHSPLDGTVGEIKHIPGQYYTVNPQAVNERCFDVFTSNTRSVLYLTHKQSGAQVVFVAIGALLVGSIVWTAGGEQGKEVKRGDELGYFAYGGSTVVAVFPPGIIEFDEDLLKNSDNVLETLMKVGYRIGRYTNPVSV